MDEKATQLHAIASLKVLLDATKPQNGAATSSAANHIAAAAKQETMLAPSSIADMPNGVANALTDVNLEAVSCTFILELESAEVRPFCTDVMLTSVYYYSCTHTKMRVVNIEHYGG